MGQRVVGQQQSCLEEAVSGCFVIFALWVVGVVFIFIILVGNSQGEVVLKMLGLD